jgi:PadR family transcriptional regulator PadR
MVMDATESTPRENLLLELRRGAIVLAVLSQLRDEEYGYSLKKLLAERGLEVDEGTLYPLLRRLEAQGLLRSRWRMEDSRPRRYYRLNVQGEKLARELGAEWKALSRAVDRLLG